MMIYTCACMYIPMYVRIYAYTISWSAQYWRDQVTCVLYVHWVYTVEYSLDNLIILLFQSAHQLVQLIYPVASHHTQQLTLSPSTDNSILV